MVEIDTGSGAAVLGVRALDAGEETLSADWRRDEAIEILIPGERAAIGIDCRTADGGRRTALLRAPMVAVLPPGEVNLVRCRRPSGTLRLRLSADYFEQHAQAALGEPIAPLVARHAVYDPFINELGQTLRDALQREYPLNDAFLRPLAGTLVVHLALRYSGATPADSTPPTGLSQQKLRRVQAYVREHLCDVLHVEQLAAEVHMSPFHFARMFKRSTGRPPHLYVVLQRIERAKQLLRDTEITLIDIAAQVGFHTQGHFTGVFHRYTGQTPRSFRLDCRAGQACPVV